ncbi:hypothetical protein Glove_199g189 [Diversispora epigaea]|uniref:Uncharacterized protein n=1 Tax=Diversispora epigaea TaxID=1348612 RepID=A0A397IK65_9GLOM|nr:hypothetical protein Glove_199g189 [Diversispora epigaea]
MIRFEELKKKNKTDTAKSAELKDRVTKLEQKQVQVITNEQKASSIMPLIEGRSGEEGITPDLIPELKRSSTQFESSAESKHLQPLCHKILTMTIQLRFLNL